MSTATMTPASTLLIEVRGEVVSSTFDTFAGMVRARLGEINRDLATDEDFDQADKNVRAIEGAEKALKDAKSKALADAEQLHALFSQIDDLSGELAAARLDLSKQIKKRKEEIVTEIVDAGIASIDCAERFREPVFGKSLAVAAKGKRSIDTMRKAVTTMAAIHNATIGKARKHIDSFVKAHGPDLVPDREDLEVKAPESVEVELRRRFEAKKSADALKAQQDATARANAEAVKAKQELAESGKPPLPSSPAEDSPFAPSPTPAAAAGPVATNAAAPTAAQVQASEAQEWAAFEAQVGATLGALKPVRAALKHPKNIARAQVFANAVGAAWNNR